LRRTSRGSRPPVWAKDYICPTMQPSSSTCLYPMSNYMGYDTLGSAYQSYLTAMTTYVEPTSYHQAMKDQKWIDAMQAEIDALVSNNTWEVVPIPKGKVPIGCK
ncbi:hypothetical protein A4A49_62927, partial [Nicotiana attenuata]